MSDFGVNVQVDNEEVDYGVIVQQMLDEARVLQEEIGDKSVDLEIEPTVENFYEIRKRYGKLLELSVRNTG